MKKLVLSIIAGALVASAAAQTKAIVSLSANANHLRTDLIAKQTSDVALTRYLFEGYNTLCLPMSVSAEKLNEMGLTAERFVGIDQQGTVVTLYFTDCTAEGLRAGMPYLVRSAKSQTIKVKTGDASFIDTDINVQRLSDNRGNTVAFLGSWDAVNHDGRYGIPAQQNTFPLQAVLERTDGSKTFLPTRCGFLWEQQAVTAHELRIEHVANWSETTAISAIASDGASVDVYDLSGKLVKTQVPAAQLTKTLKAGVYLINGNKVMVR